MVTGRERVKSERTFVDRVRSEYAEMPGMRLTAAELQRLCGVERLICRTILDVLMDAGYLKRHDDGTYSRASEDPIRTNAPQTAGSSGTAPASAHE
jgi:hypothetical protein